MIVFDYFFEKSGHPKFYQPVVDMMEAANHACMDESTLHAFVSALKDRLDDAKPSFGHGAHITTSLGLDGYIHLESGSVDDDIARLAFFTIRHRLEWNCIDSTFFKTPPPDF